MALEGRFKSESSLETKILIHHRLLRYFYLGVLDG